MNYYNEIKNKILDNEIYCKIKDYSKEKNTLITYYEIGKLLNEVGKKYNVRYLYDMKKLYLFSKVHPLGANLTMSHYRAISREYQLI